MKSTYLRPFSLVICCIYLTGCSIMNKQKSKQEFSTLDQRTSTSLLDQSLSEELLYWQQSWMLESQYKTFFVQSDSGVIIHPDQTIEMNSGTMFFTQSIQQSKSTDETKTSRQEHINRLEVSSVESEIVQENTSLREKEKFSINFWGWLMIATLAVWLVFRR